MIFLFAILRLRCNFFLFALVEAGADAADEFQFAAIVEAEDEGAEKLAAAAALGEAGHNGIDFADNFQSFTHVEVRAPAYVLFFSLAMMPRGLLPRRLRKRFALLGNMFREMDALVGRQNLLEKILALQQRHAAKVVAAGVHDVEREIIERHRLHELT